MILCGKKDDNWLTAIMLEADAFGGCSEDGTVRKKMKTYVRNMLARHDLVILAPVVGKMIHTFQKHNSVMYEIHTAIRQGCNISGRDRVKYSKEACEWMIKNRGARKFFTYVPAGNRAAGIYAVACGMVRVGVITSAIKKDGILVDMALYQSRDEDVQEILRSM